eukprot:jgi/Mesvir1/29318/Mv25736-RA.1
MKRHTCLSLGGWAALGWQPRGTLHNHLLPAKFPALSAKNMCYAGKTEHIPRESLGWLQQIMAGYYLLMPLRCFKALPLCPL